MVIGDNEICIFKVKEIMLCLGLVFFVFFGIEIDYKIVFISDEVVKLEMLFQWIVIIGSGYIGLEFFDVYIVFGCEVIMIEVLLDLMLGFDLEIVKIVEWVLIKFWDIEIYIGVFVIKIKVGFFVEIEFIDVKIKEVIDILEVDVCLVVIGCIFVIKNLGLEMVGVEIDCWGFIEVND